MAGKYVEPKSKCAVATVPASLDVRQMSSIRRTATDLGIEILEEPIAAYYACSVKQEDENSLVLVLDLGGGSSKASLL